MESLIYYSVVIIVAFTFVYSLLRLIYYSYYTLVNIYNENKSPQNQYLLNAREYGYKPISIILPYSKETTPFFRETLENLKQLDYPNFEIIVVSEKECFGDIEDILRLKKTRKTGRYSLNKNKIIGIYKVEGDIEVTVILQENDNLYEKINTGIDNCKSELFTLIHKGVNLHKESLKEMSIDFGIEDNTCVVMGSVEKRDKFDFKNIIGSFYIVENIKKEFIQKRILLNKDFLIFTNKDFSLYNRSFVLEVGGFNPMAIQPSLDLLYRLRDKFSNVKFSEQAVAYDSCEMKPFKRGVNREVIYKEFFKEKITDKSKDIKGVVKNTFSAFKTIHILGTLSFISILGLFIYDKISLSLVVLLVFPFIIFDIFLNYILYFYKGVLSKEKVSISKIIKYFFLAFVHSLIARPIMSVFYGVVGFSYKKKVKKYKEENHIIEDNAIEENIMEESIIEDNM